MREASFGHGPLVPLLFDLVLPFLPLACMPLADAFFAFLDPIRQGFVDFHAFAASGGERRVQSTTSSAAIRSTPLKASGWKLTFNGWRLGKPSRLLIS